MGNRTVDVFQESPIRILFPHLQGDAVQEAVLGVFSDSVQVNALEMSGWACDNAF